MQQQETQQMPTPQQQTSKVKSSSSKKKSKSKKQVQETAPVEVPAVQETAPVEVQTVQETAPVEVPAVQETAQVKKQSSKSTKLKKPTKTRSAYNFYSKEQYPTLKVQNPEHKFADIQKLVSAQWKQMTDEQKETYVKQSDTDKERYTSEMAEYNSQPDELKVTKKKKKKNNGPKRALSTYMLYKNDISKSIKEANPEISFGDLQKKVGENWKNLKESSSKADVKTLGKFEKLHLADKARYEKELAEFNEQQQQQDDN